MKDKFPKISIRWRKSSATYVVYKGREIWQSGFGSYGNAEYFVKNGTRLAEKD